MSEEAWDGLEPALKKEWVSGAMTASGSTGGAASAFQRGKKHALESGVREDQWKGMTDELKQHWVSLVSIAMTISGRAAAAQAVLSDQDVERAAFRALLAAHWQRTESSPQQ